MPSLRRHSSTKLCDGAQVAIFQSFLRPVFTACHVQHISDLHCKFALRPITPRSIYIFLRVIGLSANLDIIDIQSATVENRRGKRRRIIINQSMILLVLQLTSWISYNKYHIILHNTKYKTRMWANAQRDGRPAE